MQCSQTYNIGNEMKWKKLAHTFIMISNKKKNVVGLYTNLSALWTLAVKNINTIK